MDMYTKGLTVKGLIEKLNKVVDKDLPIILSSDEERNTLFQGFFINICSDGVVLTGLSGCELDEDEFKEPQFTEEDFKEIENAHLKKPEGM